MIPAGIETTTQAAAETASKAAESGKKLADDLDHFLTLLTTQLKHQDPLEPMDATEFTSQLVEFASVEQQIYANANLEKLIAASETTQLAALVGYIGMATESEGQDFVLSDGAAEVAYDLATTASSTTITISDRLGRTVYTTGGETDQGKHYFAWDGKDLNDIPMDDGTYKVTVSALDYEGNPVEVQHSVFGIITGVSNDDGEAKLYIGDLAVPFDSVVSVRRPATAPQQPTDQTQ